MKMSIGEMIDRYTILQLKENRTDLNITDEKETYYKEIMNYDPKNDMTIGTALKDLKNINGEIGDLESDIRKGKEDELGLEEVGKRALKIRDLNSRRVELKNYINSYFEEGFEEIKKDHVSEK